MIRILCLIAALLGLAGSAVAQPNPGCLIAGISPALLGPVPVCGPTLDLNFLTGTPDPRVTFARASIGTYFDVTGTMQTAAANAPRFDYDPVTHLPLGLLIEEQRTNSLRNPRAEGAVTGVVGAGGAVATNWTAVNNASGLTLNVAPISAQGMTGIRLSYTGTTVASPNAETVEFEARSIIAAAVGQTWTGSFNYRLASGILPNGVTLGTRILTFTSGSVVVDNNTVVVATVDATIRRSINPLSSVGATAATIVSGINMTGFPANTAASFAIDVFFPQLELGAFATSVILPLVGTPAAATRAADVASMPVGAWFNRMAGTLGAEASIPYQNTLANNRIVSLDDGTTANRIVLYLGSNSWSVNGFLGYGGAQYGGPSTQNISAGAPFKAAATLAGANVVVTVGGAPVSLYGAAAGYPTGIAVLSLGYEGGTSTQINGYLRRIRYWPRALSSGELQQVTQ